MPIRKEFRHFYKGEWKVISRERKEQANHRCEFCGAPDRTWIARDAQNPKHYYVIEGEGQFAVAITDGDPLVFIVLTVAHLNHDPSDNRPDNLRALCQRCHLRYDAKHHAQSRRMNRRKAQIEQGQGEFEL